MVVMVVDGPKRMWFFRVKSLQVMFGLHGELAITYFAVMHLVHGELLCSNLCYIGP